MAQPSKPRLPVLLLLILGLFLASCMGSQGRLSDDDDDADDDDDDDAGDDDDDDDDSQGTFPAPTYDGTCPDFDEGLNTGFESSGSSRQFRLALPDDPEGAPVVFAWHWLGGSAQQIMDWLDFGDLAEDEGAIVVAPDSDGYPYEWRWDQPSQGNADAKLFEDLLACLHEHYAVDLGRVHTSGMSAGGLWSSWLILNRSQWFASAAPLSGGVYADWYFSPQDTIPVMLTWGGFSDVYNGFSFDVASEDFSAELRADGHFVVECDHGGGHTVPSGAAANVWRFFEAHPKGEDTSPWEGGLPGSLPSYCTIP